MPPFVGRLGSGEERERGGCRGDWPQRVDDACVARLLAGRLSVGGGQAVGGAAGQPSEDDQLLRE